ncbi:uncharacterized protein LOC127773478 [Oryza glaberrima]|uniref:uncharacterized protein LOC127773478 n=1 Tax=Oryza glaberrima TaxID=4538 RepID=UPI00224C53D8|nr:uncharacterized protein LOC127773478 [Oryza glaberrima]
MRKEAEMAGEARSEVEKTRMAALAAGSQFIDAKRILKALEQAGEVALSLIESLKHKATSVVATTTKSTFMGCGSVPAARGQQDDNDAGEDQKLDSGPLHTHATRPTHAFSYEDAHAHLQQFLEICSTYTVKGVILDAVRIRLFPFSLVGKVKQWFYVNRATINTWDRCSIAFLSKFFPMGKTNALRGRISRFQSIPEAWERLQEYVAACPHHGMDAWLILQSFYNGLTPMSRDHLDTAARGAFYSKTVSGAIELIEKIVSNMGWSEERLQSRQQVMHTVKETEMLAAKLDLLMKRLDEHEKKPQGTVKALDSHVTCEVCGNTGHSPKTHEEAMFMGNNNNGFRPQGGQGWNQPHPYFQGGNNSDNFSNQPSLKDLVFVQAKTTNALSKKMAANDKILENINVKLDGFASAFQNQLSFNKMIQTHLAQLAALVPANESGRILKQPEPFVENVKTITTRRGKSTRDPPYPNSAGTRSSSSSS